MENQPENNVGSQPAFPTCLIMSYRGLSDLKTLSNALLTVDGHESGLHCEESGVCISNKMLSSSAVGGRSS